MSRESPRLTVTERYILSQLLVCGAITPVEYENVVRGKFGCTVREEKIEQLSEKGFLEHTLYQK